MLGCGRILFCCSPFFPCVYSQRRALHVDGRYSAAADLDSCNIGVFKKRRESIVALGIFFVYALPLFAALLTILYIRTEIMGQGF